MATLPRRPSRKSALHLNGGTPGLRAEITEAVDAGKRLAAYLADIASAWRMATAEERNALARQLFTEAIIANQTAVAVVPRPEMRPFFEYWEWQQRDEIMQGRKRRASVT